MDFLTPKFASIETWLLLSGMSKRNTYEHLGRGDLKAYKVGRRTLIDVEHGLLWIRSRPAAEMTPMGPRKQAGHSAAAEAAA